MEKIALEIVTLDFAKQGVLLTPNGVEEATDKIIRLRGTSSDTEEKEARDFVGGIVRILVENLFPLTKCDRKG